MANNIEAWEADQAWFLLKRPDATEDQIEKFCESVAKHWQYCGDDLTARNRALEDL